MVVAPDRRTENVPRHVAVIMDANGRWAEERGLPRLQGHTAGTENIREIIRLFGERGVRVLTLYAFSTENWRRPPEEVSGLMHILSQAIERELQPLHEAGVRLRYIGQLEGLDPPLRAQIERAVERTAQNRDMTVCVAFNYGGRSEILGAVQALIAEGAAPEEIDEQRLGRYLYTTGLPDPDFIIRTGGQQRLSNFLIWQAAYAEYYFTDTYWPDFRETDVDAALKAYAQRVRKFGGLAPEPADTPGVPDTRVANAAISELREFVTTLLQMADDLSDIERVWLKGMLAHLSELEELVGQLDPAALRRDVSWLRRQARWLSEKITRPETPRLAQLIDRVGDRITDLIALLS